MPRKQFTTDRCESQTAEAFNNTRRTSASKQPISKKSALNNPFAIRHVAPGEIPYFFSSADDLHQIVQRADKASWTGQIVGPHGSGKTTLARHLSGQLQKRFDTIEFLIVRGIREIQVCRRLEGTSHQASRTVDADKNGKTLYVIDGVERLSWLQRKLLVADCRRKQIGLLVTAHRRLLGLPVFYETSFDKTRFGKILHHLGTEQYEDHYDGLKAEFGDNCREMLFELYDDHIS